MVKPVNLTFEELSRVLGYDAKSGVFVWKETVSSRGKKGQVAGVKQTMHNGKDYLSITYRGRKMSGSQVAWLLHYGEWPDRSVFFLDDNPENLRIANLKLADHKAVRVVGDDGKVKYKMSGDQSRHYGLKRNYDLSLTEYAQMFAAQGGVCAICKQPETHKKPGRKVDGSDAMVRDLSVDHCHATGNVRELLCNACNHMLGAAKDDDKILMAAAAYIRKHSAKEELGTSIAPTGPADAAQDGATLVQEV